MGLRKLLNWLSARYSNPKIYIFESGVSVPGENDKPVDQAVHDQFRIDYYSQYIDNVKAAITEDGVNV